MVIKAIVCIDLYENVLKVKFQLIRKLIIFNNDKKDNRLINLQLLTPLENRKKVSMRCDFHMLQNKLYLIFVHHESHTFKLEFLN